MLTTRLRYTITFGFQPSPHKHLYGIMIYHHGRLIRPYVRVGVQLQPNEHGLGVLGVMEADFLDPTHNKQDFHDVSADNLECAHQTCR